MYTWISPSIYVNINMSGCPNIGTIFLDQFISQGPRSRADYLAWPNVMHLSIHTNVSRLGCGEFDLY